MTFESRRRKPLPYTLYRMLVKQSIGVAIVLFWCVMNGLSHQASDRRARAAHHACAAREKITDNIEEWWGVFYRGEKIGYATQTITPKAKGLHAARSLAC